jgi:hypothetical protein
VTAASEAAPTPETKPGEITPPTTIKGSNVKASKSTVANPIQVVHKLAAEMVKANRRFGGRTWSRLP